ncbi:MAG: transglycosylase SLT domain-containing protein [Campylobacter sp.]|nr:transglycosylase SLT domain-containing protein [Campylobacter sp.]
MRIVFKFALILLLPCAIFAEILSYEELKDKPKSLAKDYYIYRLIDETKYDKKQIRALKQSGIYRNKGKLKKELDKIFPPVKPKDKCAGVGTKNILDANLTCIKARLYPAFIAKLPNETKLKLASKLEQNYPNLANRLIGFSKENPLAYFESIGDSANFLSYYKYAEPKSLNLSGKNEALYTNLGANEDFYATLQDLVINKKHKNFRIALLNANPSVATPKNAFLLGVNAVMFDEEKKAIEFFKTATKVEKSAHNADNAKFWVYLLSGDESVLKELANSANYNIYSLYAKELTGNKSISVIIPEPTADAPKNYDITDPFNWVRTKAKADKMSKAELIEFAKFFDTKATIGEYSYIMNKATGYKDNFYAMPFMEFIGDGDNHRKALLLAIGRQESRFIPGSVSTSYALGMMQFMPFVANDLGKKQLKMTNFDQDDMFKPQIAYKFANLHIDYLEKSLISPVFIAYAYNGGLGFTKRLLQRGDLFNKGKYEPFLSMELVTFAESRDYGKKVLANYIIYRQILEPTAKISVKEELEKLLNPSLSDKIR